MRPIPRLPLLAFLLLVPVAAFAQQFEEKLTINYVEVPVTVIGKDGKPVRGLTQANFEVYDNDSKRKVESFEAIDFGAAETHKVISPLNPASRRNFLILFDTTFSSPMSLGRAQAAARDFVERGIGRRDLIAIATINVEKGFRLLTAFTSDRNLLAAAIADPGNFQSHDPLAISSADFMVTEGPQGAGEDMSSGRGVSMENAVDFNRIQGQMDDAHRRMRIKKQLELFGEVASMLQRIRGRKHLVLLSEGFDARLIQGRDNASSNEQQDENSAIAGGRIWQVDSDVRFGSTNMQTVLSEMAEEFRRADVVLHGVDIQGVRVQNDIRSGAKVNSNNGLFLLANSTGGTVFRNSNDIASDFQRLSELHQVVYVLGFRAPAMKEGEFHDLRVKLVNAPGAKAHHRGGYYETGNETALERTLSNAEIILNDIPQDDISVATLTAAFPTASDKGEVPIILEISGADLAKAAKNDAATMELFVYAFDEDGIARDSMQQRVRLDLRQVGEKLRASGIKFYGTLELAPGKYAVKTLVRVAETEKRGFQRVDLTVPGEYDVAVLQPMFFEEPGEWIMVKHEAPAEQPYPFVIDGESFIPSAKARLRKGEPRLFAVFVYNADPDELTWDIPTQAKLVSRTRGEFVTKYVFALEQVAPGMSTLDVTVKKSGSSEARTVSVPVVVQ